jgi:putative aldouronate transport system substrate-binding protein
MMKKKKEGFIIRKDMLDEIGMEIPTTISEWYDVLIAFRDVLGLPFPYSSTYGRVRDEAAWAGAFGFYSGASPGGNPGFYQVNGTVMYGMIHPNYVDYLEVMRHWYAEGLIDPDIITINQVGVDGKFTTDQVGATMHSPDAGIGVYMQMMIRENPDVNLQPAPYPTLERGERRIFGGVPNSSYTPGDSAAITTSARDPAGAARFLDYNFSDEGFIFNNFGIEGTSYHYVNGVPTFMDFITNNPDGMTFKQAMTMWCRADVGGPFVRHLGPIMAQREFPQQNVAANLWWSSIQWDNYLPNIPFNRDEQEVITDIMSEINTMQDEMTIRIIIGELPLEHFDTFVESARRTGIDRVIEQYQSAYDRFMAR